MASQGQKLGRSGVVVGGARRGGYDNFVAQGFASQGRLQAAELAEAGHGCSLCHTVKDGVDAQIDLAHYDSVAEVLDEGRTAAVTLLVPAGASMPGARSPASFGLETIAESSELHPIWENAMRSAASSPRTNDYQRYLAALENGAEVSSRLRDGAFNAVNSRFLKAARAEGFNIAETHHWNYSRGAFPEQIVDPRHLVPVPSSELHVLIHSETTSNAANIFAGPIAPVHVLEFNTRFYPLAPRLPWSATARSLPPSEFLQR